AGAGEVLEEVDGGGPSAGGGSGGPGTGLLGPPAGRGAFRRGRGLPAVQLGSGAQHHLPGVERLGEARGRPALPAAEAHQAAERVGVVPVLAALAGEVLL